MREEYRVDRYSSGPTVIYRATHFATGVIGHGDDHLQAVEDMYLNLEKVKPQTWALPDEPGPEVKGVRDEGFYFIREPQLDGGDRWRPILDTRVVYGEEQPRYGYPITWGELIGRGFLLTDATHELEEE